MSALDHIKDRSNKRTKLPAAKWRGLPQRPGPSGSFIEVDGTEKGPLDWERSRFLDGQLWAYFEGQYWVLDTANDIDHPPGPPPKFGPQQTFTEIPEGVCEDDVVEASGSIGDQHEQTDLPEA